MSDFINGNDSAKTYSTERRLCPERVENSCEYVLPDYMGDVKRVLKYSATPSPCDVFEGSDEVTFLSVICYRVLYVDHEDLLREASFTSEAEINVPRCQSCTDHEIELAADNVTIRLAGPRKICARASVIAQICEVIELPIPECALPAEAERLTVSLPVYTAGYSKGEEREYADEIGRLPGVGCEEVELISTEAIPYVISAKMTDGGVESEAYALVRVLLSSHGEIISLEKRMPLDKMIGTEGFIGEDATPSVRFYVKDVTANLNNGAIDSGAASMYTSVVVSFTAESILRIGKNEQISVVTDAFVPDMENNCEYGKFTYRDRVCSLTERRGVSCESKLPEVLIRTVTSVDADARGVSWTAVDGGVKLEAEVTFRVIFCGAEEGQIWCERYSTTIEEELRSKEICDDCTVYGKLTLCDCRVSFDAERVYCSATAQISASAEREMSESILAAFGAQTRENATLPSVTVYYPDATDSVWSIAKRYAVSTGSIRENNALADIEDKAPLGALADHPMIIVSM